MRWLVPWLAAVSLGACGAVIPVATQADAERAHVPLAQLHDGRTLLLRRCGGCHATPEPSDKYAPRWPAEVAAMSERAHLSADERGLITAYLVAMAPSP